MKEFNNDINIVFCGEAGQGIETVSEILLQVFKLNSLNVFSTKEYMSRIRGGCNTSDIRISSKPTGAPLNRIDLAFLFSNPTTKHFKSRLNQDSIIFYDSHINLESDFTGVSTPLTELSSQLGSKIYLNVISAGLVIGLFNLDLKTGEKVVEEAFKGKSEEIIEKNKQALKQGYELGKQTCLQHNIKINIEKDNSVSEKLLISGNDAIALGCIAGGCDFVSAYPMSPSTGVLTYLSKQAQKFNIIVEQAEDEIASINMGIGPWYAGARALATTSGGGFALMTEGVSLAGMLESPMVIYIAQRPGPATGLPTRTAQEDLELALYAGHGEFPRIILTPGNLQDCFELSQNAFNLADKYQVPVFILSDQYIVDSVALSDEFNPEKVENKEYIEKTAKDYKRYQLTSSGISPRGIPAYGEGLVGLDSDEHDEEAHITEDLELRIKMQEKRLKKFDLINQEVYEHELFGNKDYKTLVVAWGSTRNAVKEAVEALNSSDIAFLYLKQVYPLHKDLIKYLSKAENSIIVENNSTGQLAKLIKRETGFEFSSKILKFNGLPFTTDELIEQISSISPVGSAC